MEEYGNFIDYLNWRGDLSFDKSPFNCVDALILSQLVYLNFDQIISEDFKHQKNLYQINQDFKNITNYKERCILGAMINCETPDLLQKCADSKRYSSVLSCGYRAIMDNDKEEQFAALTFILNNSKKNIVVVFRGTDDTFLGWKEDFNLSYLDVIPSEIDSLKYFEHVNKAFNKKMIIAGHSKGGSNAIYTATNCSRKLQKKILSIYNFDGPGFTSEFINSKEFCFIKEKLYSYYPKFSVVGMMFEHDRKFQIVRSSGKTFMQHDPFSWNVIGDSFVSEIDFAEESKGFSIAFNQWAKKLSSSEKEYFVDTMFDIIESSGVTCNKDLENNKLSASKNMVSKFAKLDSKTRKELLRIITYLLKLCKDNVPILSMFKMFF